MNSSANPISRINPEVHVVLLLAFFYGFTALNIPHGGGDLESWSDWAIYIKEHGIRNVYSLHTHPAPGQPPSFIYGPVYMYLLYFWGKWQGSIELIRQSPHLFKRFILIFDMVGIWFALRYVRDKVNRPFYALFLLFNIGLLYNTVNWGQADGAIACLVLVAVYYGLRGQLAWSGISFMLGLLIKPQPIIFLPVLGLLWLRSILKNPLKHTLVSLLSVALVVAILLWPFLQAGTFINYWSMLQDSTSVYPILTVNAANLWTLLFTENTDKMSDQLIWAGLSYKQWGLLMFSVSYVIMLLPLVKQFYQIIRGKRTQYDPSTVLLIAGLVPIVFYFFNTQMHERYAHPCVLLLAAYALSSGDFIPYIVASVANLWVMDRILKFFSVYTHISLELIAVLFLFVLVWGVVQLYRKRLPAEREVALV